MGLQKAFLFVHLCMLLTYVRSQNWKNDIILDIDGAYHFYWNPPEDKRNDSKITFKVEMKAKSCFVFGLSPNGGISGSDIVIGCIKDGEVHFQDRHADGSGLLFLDDQQNYELIVAYKNDTFMVFEFRRNLNTCDRNDTAIDESTMTLFYDYTDDVLAYDPANDPIRTKGITRWKNVLLLQYNLQEGFDINSSSFLEWDTTTPDIEISSTDAMLWCKIVKSPQISEKHHIVRIKPMIQEGHKEFVFYMTFLECIGGTPEEYEKFVEHKGYECDDAHIPQEMMNCQGFIAAWLIGGGDIILPEHVGLPLYPGRYFLFKIDYQNLQHNAGIIDRSGLRYIYTPNLREFDGGVYTVGASLLPRTFIPPRLNEYVVAGHTTPGCVSSSFPESGAKISAILLHTNSLGKRVRLRHFRGNKELVPLAYDTNYEPYYQEYRYFKEERTILKNDQITLECTYDSSQTSTVALGGLSSTSEMCTAVMLYYPCVENRHFSLSGTTYANINKVLNINITNEGDIAVALSSYNWSSVNIDDVQYEMRYSEQETQCYFGPFREDEYTMLVSYPSDLIPYEPESICNVTQ